jgi:NodT family efflux transporter outer membrane factor (OMF) lipoprotein
MTLAKNLSLHHARRLGALAALLTLGSWASADSLPPETATAAVPARWQQDASATPRDVAALAQWWRQFNDPVLDELIAGALQTSPDIRTVIAKIDEARARHGVQRSNLLPSLTASASGQGGRSTNRHTDVTTTSESAGASLDASWEIDLFGKQRQALTATAADLAQSEENFRNVQVSLAAEVAAAYVSLRSAEAQMEVVNRSLRTREETAQLTGWREQAGTASALETQQALSTLEQARASLPSLELSVAQTRNQLALLSGRTPGALDALLATTAKIPAAPAAIATGIPAETLSQRPDVRAAARAVTAAAARTSSARRDRLPTLTLSGSVGVEALRAGKLFSPESTIASILGGLTAPIFAGGKITQTIAVQSALERQALISYESTVLTALSEVEDALISVQRNAERLAILDRAVAAAREASTLAGQQYAVGQVDLLTVLETQRTLLSLEEQQVGTTADQTTACIQLYKALGGGWSQI